MARRNVIDPRARPFDAREERSWWDAAAWWRIETFDVMMTSTESAHLNTTYAQNQ